MIIITICEKTEIGLEKAFRKAVNEADLVEVRCDFLKTALTGKVKKVLSHPKVLLTLRSNKEGGQCRRDRKSRHEYLKEIIGLKPAYLDLEYARDLKLLDELKKQSKKTKVILSYHSINRFPSQLEQKLFSMQKHSAWKYKIAVFAKSVTESLKMLCLVKEHKNFIGICMGEKGMITRVIGPLFHQPFTFCYLEGLPAAPGQISYQELTNLYHYRTLNPKTKLLGIIGNPLWQSPGYKTYNSLFKKENINAIYLNFEIKPRELGSFINYCKKLNVFGLSVTIPFKEKILAYVAQKNPIQKDIGSVNTLLFKKEGLYAMNTDGLGAVELLETSGDVKNKKVLIIGAGGTACGIGHALKSKKASVTIINRTDKKAKKLARSLKADFKPFNELSKLTEQDYDILIHTTPVGNNKPNDTLVPNQILFSKKRVLDVVFTDTKLLKNAQKKQAKVYNGKTFWVYQAAKQFELWFNSKDSNLKAKLKAHMP